MGSVGGLFCEDCVLGSERLDFGRILLLIARIGFGLWSIWISGIAFLQHAVLPPKLSSNSMLDPPSTAGEAQASKSKADMPKFLVK
jgi:hypothetical protein